MNVYSTRDLPKIEGLTITEANIARDVEYLVVDSPDIRCLYVERLVIGDNARAAKVKDLAIGNDTTTDT